MARKVISTAEGIIQMRKDINESFRPPTLYATPTSVCVEVGPGNICASALSSSKSASETKLLFLTKYFNKREICAWAPPKAVNVKSITFLRKRRCFFFTSLILNHLRSPFPSLNYRHPVILRMHDYSPFSSLQASPSDIFQLL